MASEIAARLRLVAEFPALKRHPFEITSDPADFYNCIAWAAGDNARFWWPGRFWPKDVGKAVRIETFRKAFASVGYEVCDGSELEPEWEKVAIYELDGAPTHAARQLSDGRWSSKLGRYHDIAHTLEGLNGDQYGTPTVFMRRARR